MTSGIWMAGLVLFAVAGAGGAFASEPVTPVPASAGSGSAGSSAASVPSAPKAAAGPADKAGGQPINLALLEQRLRDTSALGVMTKITLKNQVDELIERFKAHHEGRDATPLSQLRPPFDTLIQRVTGLLQDGDPSLARSIAASREALWSMLTDRSQFAKL